MILPRVKSLDLPIPIDQEDSDQREPRTSERLSFSERERMILPSTSLEEKSRREIRLSTKPQRSKDSSPRRRSEERPSSRETSRTDGTNPRMLIKLMRSSSPSTLRKRRPLIRPSRKPTLFQLRLPQSRPPQPRLLQLKPLLQLRPPPQPKLLPQPRPLPLRKERSE